MGLVEADQRAGLFAGGRAEILVQVADDAPGRLLHAAGPSPEPA